MKTCSKCGIEKPFEDYAPNEYGKNGFYSICRACCRIRDKIYRVNNREKIKKQREPKREEHIKYNREYYIRNREYLNKCNKKWDSDNIEKRRRTKRKYYKEKLITDPIYRLKKNISRVISHSLNGNKNGWHWEDLVGYTQEELRNHLEAQFRDGMNWENYGYNGWTIDHKIPKSLFNITSAKCKGFKACWSLENLQPMWQSDNRKKSNKLFI